MYLINDKGIIRKQYIKTSHGLFNSIEFVWGKPNKVQQMEMYQKRMVYKMQHTSNFVPRYYNEDLELDWVHNQRTVYNNKLLSVENLNYLESIEFVCKPLV